VNFGETQHVERLGDVAVVECEGRIVRSEAAFQLRDAVTSQSDAHIILVDLSEVDAIEGGGLDMLVFLERWAWERGIRFKLFNPTRTVQDKLERTNSMPDLEIATLDEVMAHVTGAASRKHFFSSG
jgi:anti-anti-sigma regulatory factor